MRIVFAGTPEVALPTLKSLAESDHQVVGVVTRPPARQGRKSTLVPSPVAQLATELNIPLLETSKPAEQLDSLRALDADLGVVVAYGALLNQDVLEVPQHGWINLHFSDLPRWRGAAPVQHTIWSQDPYAATSVFQLERGLDTGPVYSVRKRPLTGTETSGELLEELAQLGGAQLLDSIEMIAAGMQPTPQPEEGETYASRLARSDAFVDFSGDARAVDAHIRAMTPAPGAWTTFNGAPMKMVSGGAVDASIQQGNARFVDGEVIVGCAEDSIRLAMVAPAGKKWMDAASWWRGHKSDNISLGDK